MSPNPGITERLNILTEQSEAWARATASVVKDVKERIAELEAELAKTVQITAAPGCTVEIGPVSGPTCKAVCEAITKRRFRCEDIGAVFSMADIHEAVVGVYAAKTDTEATTPA